MKGLCVSISRIFFSASMWGSAFFTMINDFFKTLIAYKSPVRFLRAKYTRLCNSNEKNENEA